MKKISALSRSGKRQLHNIVYFQFSIHHFLTESSQLTTMLLKSIKIDYILRARTKHSTDYHRFIRLSMFPKCAKSIL